MLWKNALCCTKTPKENIIILCSILCELITNVVSVRVVVFAAFCNPPEFIHFVATVQMEKK